MNIRARIAVLLAAFIVTVTFAGCSKNNGAKEDMMQALENQQQLTSQMYHGSLALDLGTLPLNPEDQPYTTVILNGLRQGKIEWSAVHDAKVQKRQAELRFTKSDGTAAFVVPVWQESGTLYVHVPFINLDDEFFTMPAPALVNRVGPVMLASLSALIETLDKSWFKTSREDGAAAVRLTVTKDNWQAFLNKVNDVLPDILSSWKNEGILTDNAAQRFQDSWASLTADGDRRVRLAEGEDAYLEMKISEDGYISELIVICALEMESKPGTFERYAVEFRQQWDSKNEPVTYTMDTPDVTVSIDQLLKYIP